MKNTSISLSVPVFRGRQVPEPGKIIGYAALIEALNLPVPLPERIALIGRKVRGYETDGWLVLGRSYEPEDSLYHHLVFSMKYEGINLLFFKSMFKKVNEGEIIKLLSIEPTGQYSRKIWFLYEWLMDTMLDIPDLSFKNYVPLLDENMQYSISGYRSSRHRITNNLPGTKDFCPLIRKTEKLEKYIELNLSNQKHTYLKGIRKDLLQRASAFLLLKDSKASFTIEGESPKSKRAARWGQAIGQAGLNDLTKEELIRLQQIVIENSRFVQMGFRKKGGFVGEHDRSTGEPIPDHISARWQDIDQLLTGLINTDELLVKSNFDAVLAAAVIAFGFVIIHPFEDGNGRIHRYLIHHILAKRKFAQMGIIFPVSASILDHIDLYRQVLQQYSLPLLDYIDWKVTGEHNIEVLNETIDYYRYFDATPQAEFLYDCVKETIENIIPEEVSYLSKYDEFKRFLDDEFEMPDKMVALLVRFLEQGNGKLSKRSREKEFKTLEEKEIANIQTRYQEIFLME